MPLAVLQIIHWTFAQGAVGGGSKGSFNFSFPNTGSLNQGNWQGSNNGLFNIPGAEGSFEFFLRAAKIIIAVLIPIITIASISVSLIAMIFEVFFTFALFVAYKNGFKVEENHLPLIEEALEANITVDNEEANNGEVEQ